MDVLMCEDQKTKSKTLVMHSEDNSTSLQWYNLKMKPVYT